MEKLLQQPIVKLASVATDVLGFREEGAARCGLLTIASPVIHSLFGIAA
jgi:hypothetical protein